MRLMLDANLWSKRIGDRLRELGHDVRGLAAEPDLDGLDDEAVLELATADERVLITRNSRHFAPIARRWAEAGHDHAGVILIWSFTHRQFDEIVTGVHGWLVQYPDGRDRRGLVVSV